ncbi:hypothetical protein D9Q98_006758 [Chlorella vulgaris]|uniref:Peptidase S26 domain-containing protein n=1 Tax=Chlorella vulgaris TaxID=3077 RepID=A0A9D4TKW3_CHLVU|nr:hypothetical protein D9Q98_006758 [Chlorella vulgaris]
MRVPDVLGWLGVAYVIQDCIASIALIKDARCALEEVSDGSSGGGAAEPSTNSVSGGLLTVVDKLSPRLFHFERGDLVVLKSPEEHSKRLVRRLIALEGDFVSVTGGKLERVPKGAGWLEADSGALEPGGDSRVWAAVPLALIEGRVAAVLWPPARWGHLSPQPTPRSATKVLGQEGSLEILSPPIDEESY